MNMETLLTSREVRRAVGIPASTLEKWCREGAIVPAIKSTGRGINRRFTVPQTFAILVARWLRNEQGYDLHTAAGALSVLARYSDAALVRDFARDRTCLLTCNRNVMPGLVLRELADNPEVQQIAAGFAADGIVCDMALIDVEKPYNRLRKWLAQQERKAKVRQ
jgi:DNA-binding transcriptional MerR regulator